MRTDGVYQNSLCEKGYWPGPDGKRESVLGHILNKKLIGFGEGLIVESKGKCQGPDFSSFSNLSALEFPQ